MHAGTDGLIGKGRLLLPLNNNVWECTCIGCEVSVSNSVLSN